MVTASDTGTGGATAPLGSIEPPELRPVRPIGGINTAGRLTADDLEKCDDERMTKQQRDAPSRRGVVVQDSHFPVGPRGSTVSGRQTNAMDALSPSANAISITAPVCVRTVPRSLCARYLLALVQGLGRARWRLIDVFARKRRMRPSDPREHENSPPVAAHHRLPSSARTRFTLTRSCAPYVRIIVTSESALDADVRVLPRPASSPPP